MNVHATADVQAKTGADAKANFDLGTNAAAGVECVAEAGADVETEPKT